MHKTESASASSVTTMGTIDAELHIFMRFHGKAKARDIRIEDEKISDGQIIMPLFTTSVPYKELIHRDFTAKVPIKVTYAGPSPKPEDYYDAANGYVTGGSGIPNHSLDSSDIFDPAQGAIASYWDGTRWRRPKDWA